MPWTPLKPLIQEITVMTALELAGVSVTWRSQPKFGKARQIVPRQRLAVGMFLNYAQASIGKVRSSRWKRLA